MLNIELRELMSHRVSDGLARLPLSTVDHSLVVSVTKARADRC
jgi:hypothetical protein